MFCSLYFPTYGHYNNNFMTNNETDLIAKQNLNVTETWVSRQAALHECAPLTDYDGIPLFYIPPQAVTDAHCFFYIIK